jgi:2-polyprenyl-6-methoxyphenol hydroxylase-like FAD-dependent oxidoreductase
MDAETFALVVGGGPVGLAAAIELAWRAVPTILISPCSISAPPTAPMRWR